MNKVMAFMSGGFGWGEIVVVLLVLLLLFGAKRLPELSRSLGRSLNEFKKGREQGGDEPAEPTDQEPAPPAGSESQDEDDKVS